MSNKPAEPVGLACPLCFGAVEQRRLSHLHLPTGFDFKRSSENMELFHKVVLKLAEEFLLR